MNSLNPTVPPANTERRRVSVAAILAAAAPAAVAIVALTVPVAASIPGAGSSGAPSIVTALDGDPCHLTAINTMKWPVCAGD